MAKIQNRRGVSMGRETYLRLKDHCQRRGLPMASLVERLVEDHLAALGEEPSNTAMGIARKRAEEVEARTRDKSLRERGNTSAPVVVPGRAPQARRTNGNGHGVGGVHEV